LAIFAIGVRDEQPGSLFPARAPRVLDQRRERGTDFGGVLPQVFVRQFHVVSNCEEQTDGDDDQGSDHPK
jgi:hypothetical protein